MKFTTFDLFCSLWSILTYIGDVTSDIYLCVDYARSGEIAYFVLTLIFVAVPTCIIAMMSLGQYFDRTSSLHLRARLPLVLLLMVLGPAASYILIIYYAWKSKKAKERSDTTMSQAYSKALIQELADAKFLNLVESYTESAPQMLLQIYIVLNTDRTLLSVVPQLISITFSYISLSWCMTALERTRRLLETGVESISLDGTVVHFLSQLFIIGPRMMALGFFASLYPMWIGLIIGTHFMMMFLWYLRLSLYMQDPCATLLSDIFKSGIYAAMGIFNFLNFDEQPTKTDVFYYTVVFVENSSLIVVWFLFSPLDVTFRVIVTAFQVMAFMVGLFLLTVYYMKLHPENVTISQNFWDSWKMNKRRVAEVDSVTDDNDEKHPMNVIDSPTTV